MQPWKGAAPLLPSWLLTEGQQRKLLFLSARKRKPDKVLRVKPGRFVPRLIYCMRDGTESKFQIAEIRYWVFLK